MDDFENSMYNVEDFKVGDDSIYDGYDDDGDARYGDEYDDDLYDAMFPNGRDDGYDEYGYDD